MDACMAAASSLEGVPRGLGFQSLEQGSGANAMPAPTIMLPSMQQFLPRAQAVRSLSVTEEASCQSANGVPRGQ